jgi:predicted AAA+ superfamily ATPase
MVVVEFLKARLNKGKLNNLYFWRNRKGNEVDNFDELIPIKMKSGKTFVKNYFNGLDYWNNLTDFTGSKLIYGGSQYEKRSHGVEVILFA